MGGGLGRADRRSDDVPNSFALCQDIAIAETQDAKTLGAKKSVTAGVFRLVRSLVMLATIQLNDEMGGMRNEIDDIGADGSLTTKGNAVQSVRPNEVPNDTLRIG